MKHFFQTGRPILKITAAVLLVLAAASLVGAATYAWHILSVAPEAGLTGESGYQFAFDAQAAQAALDELKL